MAEAMTCLSDAASAVVDRTVERLRESLTPAQAAGLLQLAEEGRLFDVEALVTLADLSDSPNEVSHGN